MTVLKAVASCTTILSAATPTGEKPPSDGSAMKMQALVMGMADDYIASLGEAVYLLTRGQRLDANSRWLDQCYLRNGVGASLDIATGPNPPVNLLDLPVTASLQACSFEAHWIPAAIGDAGIPALERLKRAEAAARIAQNAHGTVVALVRFDEFADERKITSLLLRGKAYGLLREVSEASTAVDDARLRGERLLWFAGRYPYLIGEQTELTA